MVTVTKKQLLAKLEQNKIKMTPLLESAFLQAEKSHGNHKRLNGKSALDEHIYPIVSDLIDYCNFMHKKCPAELIIGALLHDVLEDDKSVAKKDFIAKFGTKIYSIVYPLTKDYSEHEFDDVHRKKKNLTYWNNILKSDKLCVLIKLADKSNNLGSDLHIVKKYPQRVRLDIESLEINFLPYTSKHNPYYHKKLMKTYSELRKYLNGQ